MGVEIAVQVGYVGFEEVVARSVGFENAKNTKFVCIHTRSALLEMVFFLCAAQQDRKCMTVGFLELCKSITMQVFAVAGIVPMVVM